MARFKVWANWSRSGDYAEAEFEVDDADAFNVDGSINESAVDVAAKEHLSNLLEWGWRRNADE